jgi:transcription initiation factor IIE alpha subunit
VFGKSTGEIRMANDFCPECESALKFDRQLEEGNIVTCPKCNAYLEVINTSPLEFDWVYDDDDYDYDYDDDDDEFDDDF